MRFEDLVEVLADRKSLPRPAADELEFRFDPVKKQMAGSFAFSATKPLRVQAQQRWEWTGDITLDDRTTARTWPLPFQITLRGTVPLDKAKAAAALKWLVPFYMGGEGTGRFDGSKMMKSVLRGVLHSYDTKIAGTYAKATSSQQIGKTQTELRDAICAAGLLVSDVELYAKNQNPAIKGRTDPLITFKDEGRPLKIRDQKLLGELAVGYLARLRFASGAAALVANYAYAGTIYGTEVGATLTDPGSSGQIQPLEAWFRQILESELQCENLDAANPIASPALVARISTRLIEGTGRELDSLQLLPALDAMAAQAAADSLSFEAEYDLHYAGKASVKIDHELLYEVTDQDRWRSVGSPVVKEFLRKVVEGAVKSFLHGKSYAAIVKLFVDAYQQKRPLDQQVQASVVEAAKAAGITVQGPVASIRDIPGSSFIGKRHPILLDEMAYQMRESDVRTCCAITAYLTLSEKAVEQQRFAKEFQDSDNFEQVVQREVRMIVAEALETRIRPAEFYNAILVVRSQETDVDTVDIVAALQSELQEKLVARFGLMVEKLDINRADRDQVAKRLYELFRHNSVSGTAQTVLGQNLKTVYRADFTVRVRNVMISSWHRFHAHVALASLQDHLNEVVRAAKEAVESFISSYSGDDDELRQDVNNGQVALQLAERIAIECGLAVEVVKLDLDIDAPAMDEGAQTKLQIRETKLARLRAKYEDGGAYDTYLDEDLEQMDRLIDEIEAIKATLRQTAQAQGKLTSRLSAPVGLLADGRPDQHARKLLGKAGETGARGNA